MRFRVVGIKAERDLIFFFRVLTATRFGQCLGVMEMLARANRQIGHDPTLPHVIGRSAMCLPEPECGQWDYENRHPFRSVKEPAWKKTACRYIDCAAGDSERFARRAFSHFPDKSVVIKMQQPRSGDDAHER